MNGGIIHYDNCPVCGSTELKEIFRVKDYTVSNQDFLILECNVCTLRFTQNIPDEHAIQVYYKSENYISHTNTEKGLINRLYHIIRKRTLAGKKKLIRNMTGLSKGAILDLGCGIGSFVNEMKQAGWEATGLEPDADARKMAKELYFLDIGDAGHFYQLQAESFDAITLWHVLEHIHDLNVYIRQLKDLLTPKGKLFVAVPNYTSFDAKKYKEYWAAYDVPRHLYHFSPASMKMLMEKHDLKIEKHKPMWYDSFYISLLSSRYKNGNANFIGACFNGMVSDLNTMFNTSKCSSVIYVISK
jgi:2-polyprenyl-3-methyl-5-hydroxy-6-metoxy-1,4-benzoquinol methylase